MNSPIWLTESEVVELLTLEEALVPLRIGISRLATTDATTLPKAMHSWSGGSLHSLGAYDPTTGMGCFKNWVNTPNGAVALLSLFDTHQGRLLAVIEAGALGMMRTSGITALATQELAAPDANEIAIIGAGRQALHQLGALALVRRPARVRFWSPTPDKCKAAAKEASQRFGVNATASPSLESALDGASIVATVTRAHEPFLKLEYLAHGAHLNAMGAILPGHAEVHPEVFAAAGIIAADSVSGVGRLREVKEAEKLDSSALTRMRELSTILAQNSVARPANSRLTIFKSVGIGASDLALAGEVYRRAIEAEMGRPFPAPLPLQPKWRRE
ncbi:ornithine cyclodeaminase family protein [Pseudomonas veronii]|jgi:ornithine cyclodeaminase/alanine dehydrogenase-like protein (mu-crystallin family)|uniref:ornithine cyclodeaminase family protein n=1 Tax=Pseudomonas veronii TaxID=76761 RepID=UPI0018E884EA|nr:ornithine cyclodeaminase family protein [Pseudomonas veronii]MBJ2180652.1 ornithine cyclodeaminase family protein [Pseudomonas veronii]